MKLARIAFLDSFKERESALGGGSCIQIYIIT